MELIDLNNAEMCDLFASVRDDLSVLMEVVNAEDEVSATECSTVCSECSEDSDSGSVTLGDDDTADGAVLNTDDEEENLVSVYAPSDVSDLSGDDSDDDPTSEESAAEEPDDTPSDPIRVWDGMRYSRGAKVGFGTVDHPVDLTGTSGKRRRVDEEARVWVGEGNREDPIVLD